jgi:LysR family hca operon transcriptional activator
VALTRGILDLAFLRAERGFNLSYQVVSKERFIVLMPSDHPLTVHDVITPQQLVGEPFIAMANKARVLRTVIDSYLESENVQITPSQGVDNPAMVMSLVSSTRGVAIIPEYAKNLLPWSVVSRPLKGDLPTVDLVVGYSEANTSPVLKLFLSRLGELMERVARLKSP